MTGRAARARGAEPATPEGRAHEMSFTRRLPLVLSTLACVALAASVAGAREPRGGGSRAGSAHSELTRTGPNGQSRTWQRDTTWQRGGGVYDRHTTLTGPAGATRTKDVHMERTDTGRSGTVSVTRRDGSTVQLEKTVTRPAPGSAAGE